MSMLRAGVLVFSAVLVLSTQQLYACEMDGDCGPGGLCIKREKRARGVCYGGDVSKKDVSKKDDVPPSNQSYERIEEAVKASEYDCTVTEDCPDGMECVIAGFHYACMKLD